MRLTVSRALECASTPQTLWPFISDTEHVNRAVGLGGIEAVPIEAGAQSAARFVVRTTSGGFPLEYEESPFEWRQHESFGVRRVMRRGVLELLEVHWSLEPSGRGTTVTLTLTAEPKHRILQPVVRWELTRFASN